MGKILIIEDEQDGAKQARKILSKFGYDVQVTKTGEQALSLIGSDLPALILLDLSLPDAGGQTQLNLLRTQSNLRHIPIIACAAWPEDTAQSISQANGFDGYIRKPYSIQQLLDLVNHYLI